MKDHFLILVMVHLRKYAWHEFYKTEHSNSHDLNIVFYFRPSGGFND